MGDHLGIAILVLILKNKFGTHVKSCCILVSPVLRGFFSGFAGFPPQNKPQFNPSYLYRVSVPTIYTEGVYPVLIYCYYYIVIILTHLENIYVEET